MIYKNDINISVNTYIMGIYYDDDEIYGICLYNFIDDVENRLYEKISETIFDEDMMNEAKQCYEELVKKGIKVFIKIYISSTTTYSSTTNNECMLWIRTTKDIFYEKIKN
jgi:hypothetical protein